MVAKVAETPTAARRNWTLLACACGYAVLCRPMPAIAQHANRDPVTSSQDAGGFNSLTDGQPGSPGELQIELTAARLTDSTVAFETSLSITPTVRFLTNALFGLIAPTLDAGEGATDFERSVTATWLQRRTCQRGSRPTLSTQVALQVPFDEPDAEVDAVVTVVVARSFGSSTIYLNGWGETTNGFTTDGMEWGSLMGLKASVAPWVFAVVDALWQTGNQLTVEISPVFAVPGGLSIGPGFAAGWNLGDGEPSISFGLQVQR